MKKSMSVLEFYQMFAANRPDVIIPEASIDMHSGHFNVFKRSGYCTLNPSPYNRRDFYKISLIIGRGVLHYPNQQIPVDGPALIFNNPTIPYSWETTSEFQSGYFCLFTESFMHQRLEAVKDPLMSRIQDSPVFYLNNDQVEGVSSIFEKMLAEMDTDYPFKYDLIRNYVHLLVHEAMKMQPWDLPAKSINASSRIATLFFELLERQFPIYSSEHVLQLRTANDFAARLSIHVNHLNHAVKEVTGKTTSEHIGKRIANEAIALLKHTEWNISEIGYCLGFEYPANFNLFFKRQTLSAPKSYRESHREVSLAPKQKVVSKYKEITAR
jgi:AraC family transcriptional activator of pobA